MMGNPLKNPHLAFLIVICAVVCLNSQARAEKLSILDNGRLRIGVDLEKGGSITLLARARGGENLINSHDLGRQVQQSYYSGPSPFGTPHPAWRNWSWNPAGSGDVHGHRSLVLEHHNDGKRLFVRTRPMQWALNNVPGDCEFETTITLEGNLAHVECRLRNHRADRTWYPAQDQELPAVYTIGKLHRLFTATADHPFGDQAPEQLQNSGPPWVRFQTGECWAALVNQEGWGVGVLHPGAHDFLGGFHGTPGRGGPGDDATGYIAPVRREILDHDIDYRYEYFLTIGTLNEIRSRAAGRVEPGARLDDHFTRDRRHWTLEGTTDRGVPDRLGWHIRLGSKPCRLVSPTTWIQAQDAPRLLIQASLSGRARRGAVTWQGRGVGLGRVFFEIPAEGKGHEVQVTLSSNPGYRGLITSYAIEIEASNGEQAELEVRRIALVGVKP